MRARAWLLVACVGVAAACSLNPQPYPPDTTDGGATFDAGMDAASAFGDSGGAGDASVEAAPLPEDAAVDASDAGDASDASDAGEATDAESDAADAERDDAADDATTD